MTHLRLPCLLFALLMLACSSPPLDAETEGPICSADEPEATASTSFALSSIDCSESSDTGYDKGTAFPITVVTVDGKKVEKETANAYYVMAQAASAAGVNIKVNSGFRTMAEQQYFYDCYINCNCNSCNLAAKPGYSNHQSGHALDLNTSSSGVLNWLNANGAAYGFKRTVPSEAWHWEWWGGGPGGGPCGKPKFAGKSLGIDGQSYPIVSKGAVTVEVGQTVTGWVKLENIGTEVWKSGTVWLAPIPRDQASPFVSASWLSATRISTPSGDVAPGAVGEFALDLTGSAEGETILELGWVAEGITWFADSGGPDDGYFAVKVNVVPSTEPPPTGSGGSAGSGGDGGDGGSVASGGSSGSGWGSGGSAGFVAGAGGDGATGDPDDDASVEGGCTIASSSSSSSAPWWVLIAIGAFVVRPRRVLS
jgi:hypothetical protein